MDALKRVLKQDTVRPWRLTEPYKITLETSMLCKQANGLYQCLDLKRVLYTNHLIIVNYAPLLGE